MPVHLYFDDLHERMYADLPRRTVSFNNSRWGKCILGSLHFISLSNLPSCRCSDFSSLSAKYPEFQPSRNIWFNIISRKQDFALASGRQENIQDDVWYSYAHDFYYACIKYIRFFSNM